jgi:hypothetical protein
MSLTEGYVLPATADLKAYFSRICWYSKGTDGVVWTFDEDRRCVTSPFR